MRLRRSVGLDHVIYRLLRYHWSVGPDHAVAGRDDSRGEGDGACRHEGAATDRGRHHLQVRHRVLLHVCV